MDWAKVGSEGDSGEEERMEEGMSKVDGAVTWISGKRDRAGRVLSVM